MRKPTIHGLKADLKAANEEVGDLMNQLRHLREAQNALVEEARNEERQKARILASGVESLANLLKHAYETPS